VYDISLRGSYGFMGDFYGDDPEDTYKVVVASPRYGRRLVALH
jgi:hypothetical protein